jgi:hypothetical protein
MRRVGGRGPRIAAAGCGARPAEQHRLLVLRQPDDQADRGIRRRRPHTTALCGAVGIAGDLRAQRRRQRIAAEFSSRRRRRHRASCGAAIHRSPRQAHGLHRQSGLFRRRRALGFRHDRPRGESVQPRRAGHERSDRSRGWRRARHSGRARRDGRAERAIGAIAHQQHFGAGTHVGTRARRADVVLREHDAASEPRQAKRASASTQRAQGICPCHRSASSSSPRPWPWRVTTSSVPAGAPADTLGIEVAPSARPIAPNLPSLSEAPPLYLPAQGAVCQGAGGTAAAVP